MIEKMIDQALLELANEGAIEQFIDEDGNLVWTDVPNYHVSIVDYDISSANDFLNTDKYDEFTIVSIEYSDGEVDRYISIFGDELIYSHPHDINQFEGHLPYFNEKTLQFFYRDENGIHQIELEEKHD